MASPTTAPPSCQTITVPICKDQPYTQTFLPNSLGHHSQDDASLEIHTFAPLIHAGCSAQLKPFLCSVYTPECVQGRARPPCRTLCEQARTGCEPMLNRFGFQWPAGLRCETFSTESCGPVGVLLSLEVVMRRCGLACHGLTITSPRRADPTKHLLRALVTPKEQHSFLLMWEG